VRLLIRYSAVCYLHVVLCFSPVGDKFRIRARQFPALVNCTQLDWFHGWPHEALLSVAQRFLADVPDVTDDVRASMAQFMAQAHQVRHAACVCILLLVPTGNLTPGAGLAACLRAFRYRLESYAAPAKYLV
jgi:hypothetical protein